MSTMRVVRVATGQGPVAEVPFALDTLRRVRAVVRDVAEAAGLARRRADELMVVVNELAANSVDHGGGRGTVRAWVEHGAVVVEVSDAGRLADPGGAGRTAPRLDQDRGRGLWIARRLADSLEIRSTADGTVARVVVRR